jgi:hypothetical protein
MFSSDVLCVFSRFTLTKIFYLYKPLDRSFGYQNYAYPNSCEKKWIIHYRKQHSFRVPNNLSSVFLHTLDKDTLRGVQGKKLPTIHGSRVNMCESGDVFS